VTNLVTLAPAVAAGAFYPGLDASSTLRLQMDVRFAREVSAALR
jgi:hypothetical protein